MSREQEGHPRASGKKAGAPVAPDAEGAAPSAPAGPPAPQDLELDLELERIDTEGVLKEGFSGQEM